jgi:hypothetical protein
MRNALERPPQTGARPPVAARLAGADTDAELLGSFIVVVFLGGVYIAYELLSKPYGGDPFGHWLGVLGTLLMVATELVYSARKRWPRFKWGAVRHWLSLHIFTGIVGPVLVLMHTGLQFDGLAGLTMLLTALVVASGFVGRYLYTAVPRTLAGVEVDRRQLEAEAARLQEELLAWSAGKSERVRALVAREAAGAEAADLSTRALLLRRLEEWREARRLSAALRTLDREERARVAEVEKSLRRRGRLVRQIRSLQAVRQAMGWWHVLHIPMGLTLFSAAAIHIVATLYYGALG